MAYQDDYNQPSGFYNSHIEEIKGIWYSRGAGPRFEELYTKVAREARHHSKWREFTEDRKLWGIDGAMWIYLNGGNDSSWTVPPPDERWYKATATWKTGLNTPAVTLSGALRDSAIALQEDLNAPSGAYKSQFQAIRGLYIEAGCAREYDVYYPQYRREVFEEEQYSNLSCDEKLWQVDFFCWRRINPWSQFPIPKPSPGSRSWGYSSTARWLTGRNAPSQPDMRGMEIFAAHGNQIPGGGQVGFVGGTEDPTPVRNMPSRINRPRVREMLIPGAYGSRTPSVGQAGPGIFGRMEITAYPGSQVLSFNHSGLPGGMGVPGSFSRYVSGPN
jgi:hypothetical protein